MALRLTAGDAVAVVATDRGGGLASLEAGGRPILSAGAGRPPGPFALAMNLLLPFSNRISRPFHFEGHIHALEPNLEGEPFPIHGDAFQRRWEVVREGPQDATLRLGEGRFGPYRYEAVATYRLGRTSLSVDLHLTSRSETALPFGLGFHPWLPREAGTRVRFRATGCWPQDDRYLPATPAPVPLPPGWRFDPPAPLPRGWINAAFSGWDSVAEVLPPGDAPAVRLSAPGLATLIVYSPSSKAPFLCLEPVSHPVDAHNLRGQPGLVRLAPGGSLSASLTIAWGPSPVAAPPA